MNVRWRLDVLLNLEPLHLTPLPYSLTLPFANPTTSPSIPHPTPLAFLLFLCVTTSSQSLLNPIYLAYVTNSNHSSPLFVNPAGITLSSVHSKDAKNYVCLTLYANAHLHVMNFAKYPSSTPLLRFTMTSSSSFYFSLDFTLFFAWVNWFGQTKSSFKTTVKSFFATLLSCYQKGLLSCCLAIKLIAFSRETVSFYNKI